jgi:hypothetical protein
MASRPGDDAVTDAPAASTPWRRGGPVQLVALFALALVPRLATVGHAITTDEWNWHKRSDAFTDALFDGRWSDMTASSGPTATMPGGSTMWLGLLGRQLHSVAVRAGLVEDTPNTVLAFHQAMVAVATSLLIVGLAVLVARWAGWGPAAVTSVALAGEPWIAAHGAIAHTDLLTALFGAAGLVALALAFDVPSPSGLRHPRRAAALAGFLVVQSPLTKIVGLAYGVGAAAIVVVALVRDRRAAGPGSTALVRRRAHQLGAAVLAGLVAVAVTWPALVADPGTQIGVLGDSIALGGAGHPQFFRGEVTTTPGPTYYPVVLALRLTPWFLLALAVGAPLAVAARATRARALWVLGWCLPVAATITVAAKQFDRYGLLVVVPASLLIGLGLGPPLDRLLDRARPARFVAGSAVAVLLLHGLTVAPHGLLYFNPLLGGGARATEVVLVGWGEGVQEALERVEELEGGDCHGTTVGVPTIPSHGLDTFDLPCTPSPKGVRPDYVVAYINQTQRLDPDELDRLLAGREQVGEVELRGITVATIWR